MHGTSVRQEKYTLMYTPEYLDSYFKKLIILGI